MGLLLISVSVQAQTNLIRNWSFEDLRPNLNGDTICPGGGGQVYLSKYWKSANGSVDYFNSCSNDTFPDFGVPHNLLGYQEAFDGEAYANVACYSDFFPDAKEYLWHELDTPLMAGVPYVCRFRVSLLDTMNFAVGSLGALVSVENTRFWNNAQLFFNAEPQVQNPVNELLDDRENWMTISGQFIAQGGERFVTIGSFDPDSTGNVQRISNHPEGVYSWESSSYLVDGVELYADTNTAVVEDDRPVISLYPNPASEYVRVQGTQSMRRIELLDLHGRVIKADKVTGREHNIDVRVLPVGVYLVQVLSNEGWTVQQFVRSP